MREKKKSFLSLVTGLVTVPNLLWILWFAVPAFGLIVAKFLQLSDVTMFALILVGWFLHADLCMKYEDARKAQKETE